MHHQKRTFIREYHELLKKFEIQFYGVVFAGGSYGALKLINNFTIDRKLLQSKICIK